MKKQEALKCLSVLKASYPSKDVGLDTINIYATMLSDLDFDEVQKAIAGIVCSSKWFPSIAEIRAEVARIATAELPAPEVAWGEVQKAIGKFGRYRVPEFSCPQLTAAVDVIGWVNICTDECVAATRARFTDAYRSFRGSEVNRIQLGEHATKPRLRDGRGPQKPQFKLPGAE